MTFFTFRRGDQEYRWCTQPLEINLETTNMAKDMHLHRVVLNISFSDVHRRMQFYGGNKFLCLFSLLSFFFSF